jgi:ABC-type sulfate transport system substrate-binding protein
MDVVELINKYGFPIVMAVGLGYIIKYVWEWSTKEVKPVLSEANGVLIALIDRIRMLDNDLIRLNQKVNTVLHLRGKMIESDRVMEGVKVEREAAEKFNEAVSHAVKKDESKTIKRRDDLDPDDVKTAAAGEG